ncbi:DoxX family protein [Henriciella litoralis]|uniref:DoxX family protein n=1 Tax=Henriciella litoralis TaxID=568102 RepID=UPI00111C7C19|nr:hypothetical protein [Henriciella litoralis]
MHWIAILIIAVWMLAGGVAHFIVPTYFYPIVPDWMPELAVVYVSGIVEIAIGVGVLLPRTRALAGLAFAALCLGFLPLHVWDFFRPDPVFEVPVAASIRIAVQFVLIGLGLWLWQRGRTPKA